MEANNNDTLAITLFSAAIILLKKDHLYGIYIFYFIYMLRNQAVLTLHILLLTQCSDERLSIQRLDPVYLVQ